VFDGIHAAAKPRPTGARRLVLDQLIVYSDEVLVASCVEARILNQLLERKCRLVPKLAAPNENNHTGAQQERRAQSACGSNRAMKIN